MMLLYFEFLPLLLLLGVTALDFPQGYDMSRLSAIMPKPRTLAFESKSCGDLINHYQKLYNKGNPRVSVLALSTVIDQTQNNSLNADAKAASALDVLNAQSRNRGRKIPYHAFLQFTKCYTDSNSKRYLYADMVRKNMYKTVTHNMAQFFHTPEDYKRVDANLDSLLHDAVHSLNEHMVGHVLDDAGDMSLALLRGRNAQNKRPLDVATDLKREDIVTTLKNRHRLEDDQFVDSSSGQANRAPTGMSGMTGMNEAFMNKLRAQQPASIASSQLASGVGGPASSPPQAASLPLNAALRNGSQQSGASFGGSSSQYPISGMSHSSLMSGTSFDNSLGGQAAHHAAASQSSFDGGPISPGSAAFATTPGDSSMIGSHAGPDAMQSKIGSIGSNMAGGGDAGLLQGMASQPPAAAGGPAEGAGLQGIASQPPTADGGGAADGAAPQEKPANEGSILGSIWALVRARGR